MPRTKHLAVFFVILLAVFILAALFFILKNDGSLAHIAVPGQRALATGALQNGKSPSVEVVRSTAREEARRSLREKLSTFEPSNAPAKDAPSVARESELPVTATPQTSEPKLCSDGSVSGSGTNSWGAINVTRSEGARIISSLALDDTGVPLRTLQLPDDPHVTGGYTCLPEGMVGIALDGRVILSAAPFATNAEGLAAYALDGFGIFGANENGGTLMSSDLDECHGHVHPIVWNGVQTSMYHYHVTEDTPYTLGCYRGVPSLVD